MDEQLNSIELYNRLEAIISNIISGYFLKMVHKWACYSGEYVNEFNTCLEDMGIFTYSYMSSKIDFINGAIFVGKEKTEPDSDIYDVSKIWNSSRCCGYDAMLLISERQKYDKQRLHLKIYLINNDENNNGLFPKFEDIKKGIEAGNYCGESLLREFCGTHKLVSPNEYDRILCYTAIYSDLEQLENKHYE